MRRDPGNHKVSASGPWLSPAAGRRPSGRCGDDPADRSARLGGPPTGARNGRLGSGRSSPCGHAVPGWHRCGVPPPVGAAPLGGPLPGCCRGTNDLPQCREPAPGWATNWILNSVKDSPSATATTATATAVSAAAKATASPAPAALALGPGPQLTLLYDGGCPLCLREVGLLRRRDRLRGRLAFVDIDAPDYDPGRFGGITYRQAMGRIHAIAADGTVLRDLEVFRRAYQLVDLGWLYSPTRWPLLGPLANAAYGFWAGQRLRWTGRPDLEQLCRDRPSCGVQEPTHPALETLRP